MSEIYIRALEERLNKIEDKRLIAIKDRVIFYDKLLYAFVEICIVFGISGGVGLQLKNQEEGASRLVEQARAQID